MSVSENDANIISREICEECYLHIQPYLIDLEPYVYHSVKPCDICGEFISQTKPMYICDIVACSNDCVAEYMELELRVIDNKYDIDEEELLQSKIFNERHSNEQEKKRSLLQPISEEEAEAIEAINT